MKMTPDEIEQHFTRTDGSYLFARWGRPIAPVVFGVDDATLGVMKAGLEAVGAVAGIEVGGVDAELGVNLMMFFCREWAELVEVPDLDRLVPDLAPLVARLGAAEANQYRIFRFDEAGAIKACFIFVRMDAHMQAVPAETIALSQAVQSIVLWSDGAFQDRSPLVALPEGGVALRPEVGQLIRAAYDPVMPAVAQDTSHALRLFARLEVSQ